MYNLVKKRVFFSVWKSSENWSRVEKEKKKDSEVLEDVLAKKKAFWKMVIQPYKLLETERDSMMVCKIGSLALPCWYIFWFYVGASGGRPKESL